MTATAAAAPKLGENSIVKVALTSAAATSIEWYDFFIYGTAAALVFPTLFFPADMPPAVAQVAAFSTFAVGFIARPLGGVVFGHFGDKLGRKRALVVALLIMGAATTLIGLLPSYATIGVAAPLLLILFRFAQGLAIGGQWGGAALLAIESAPAGRKGFYGSFAQVGVPVGVVLANLIFLVMSANLAPEAFQSWGWRVPFVLSLLLVGLGLYVQLVLEDSPEFKALEIAEESVISKQAKVRERSPLLKVIAKHPKEILLAAGSFVASNGCFYIIITYVVAYATKELSVSRSTILWAVLLGSMISAPTLLLTGAFSDRFGRRGVFMLGALLSGVWAFPFFMLINTGAFLPMLLAIAVGLTLMNMMYGPQAALFAELFSIEVRYSGASLGYQLGAILGGGFAPMIAAALLTRYHTAMAISGYMAVLCFVSLVSIFLIAETNKRT
ncbi:MFS transporter [Phenylobacterium sp.]|jgi:metabolite-proton symporter|uniref:MFS transporter n=1 Tax=Phenylobacterium sp. TaxID=1871053 RepID=UPI002F932B29